LHPGGRKHELYRAIYLYHITIGGLHPVPKCLVRLVDKPSGTCFLTQPDSGVEARH
jgi:hypothetical protein